MNAKRIVSRSLAYLMVAAVVMAMQTEKAAGDPDFELSQADLVNQSDVILLLEFKDVDKDGKATAVVKKVIKGKHDGKEVTIDLMAGSVESQGQAVIQTIKGGTKNALLFVGFVGNDPGDKDIPFGMLHIEGKDFQWIMLTSGDKGGWDMDKVDFHMLHIWDGGTDMLLHVIESIQSDIDTRGPMYTSEQWGRPVLAGKIAGKVSSARPVDINGDGKLCFFITSDAGDKLYQIKDGKPVDITDARKLTSKSQAAAWADFNADGKLDLLSFDGNALNLYTQQADGAFVSSPLDVGDALKAGCIGLDIGPNTKDGRQVIISTSASPLSLIISKDAKATAKPLVEGEFPGKGMGAAGKCFVADFDGDGLVDVLQLFANGSLLYKGKPQGQFAAPIKAEILLGKGRSAACLGDYDGDGLLDVFTTAEDGNRMWQNVGGGKFVEKYRWSGEIAYVAEGGGVCVTTCDINNDGRQDILIAYNNRAPRLFFNHGFRSLGLAHSLDLDERNILLEASAGQQAVCMGDFGGTGTQDMVLVLKDGSLYYLPREAESNGTLALTVVLPANSPDEPVLVQVKVSKRAFGATNVTAGEPAFIGVTEANPITVTWTFPGQKPQSKEVIVVDKPVRFVIGAGK